MECWGITTLIDLYGCNKDLIKNKSIIQAYIDGIIELIDMKKFGKLDLEYFGNENKSGYTAIQKIETSSITCHFSEDTGYADIIIDSCKPYNSRCAANFSKKYFDSKKVKFKTSKRGLHIYM